MAAHLPRLPVLLFVFLAVHVPSTHGDPRLPSTYDVSMCSESFWCGGVEIRYPFYLANATQATADHSGNFSCGYADLRISCKLEGQTWTPTIRLGGDDYTIESISYNNDNYDDGTILLVDSDVLLDGGDCPAVRHGVSFFNGYLTFLGCYSPSELDAFKIKCAEFKSPPGDSFVLTPDELNKFREFLGCLCHGGKTRATRNANLHLHRHQLCWGTICSVRGGKVGWQPAVLATTAGTRTWNLFT